MPDKRPNILLIFCDQLRADASGAVGNPVIRTPNLDRLAREGVMFTNAYTPSPVCVSARCSLHYGQYPSTTGCYDNGFPMPTDGRPSFMDLLTKAGYRTHGIGKCHFTPDAFALRGFETRLIQQEITRTPERDDYLKHLHSEGYDYICDPNGVRGEMYYVPQVAQMPARLHPTQWIGDRTVEFIEGEGSGDRPWFLFSSYIHPHPPFAPPNPWHKLYRAPLMPLPNVPADWESLLTHINRRQNRFKYRDQGIDRNLVRSMKAHYYACVSFIDFQVGRTLAALEKAGVLDDTLVVFTSDHGEHLGDYNSFGKRSMHDTAARVPMIVRMPGRFAPGARVETPVNLVDVAPTVLAAAGAEPAGARLDGIDMAEAAAGRSSRDLVFSQFNRAGGAIYMAAGRRWKYFYSAPDGRAWLFDRLHDPRETRNLSGVTFSRAAEREMKARLVEFLRGAGEADALDGDDFKEYPRAEMPGNPDAGLGRQDHPWAEARIPGYTDVEGQ